MCPYYLCFSVCEAVINHGKRNEGQNAKLLFTGVLRASQEVE